MLKQSNDVYMKKKEYDKKGKDYKHSVNKKCTCFPDFFLSLLLRIT